MVMPGIFRIENKAMDYLLSVITYVNVNSLSELGGISIGSAEIYRGIRT